MRGQDRVGSYKPGRVPRALSSSSFDDFKR